MSKDFDQAVYISHCYKEFIKLSPEEGPKPSIFGNFHLHKL
ncbi:hypothetical protein [Mucilaginibacter sp. SMC90]|nr:hypothetical protein [Mucilaginibacter sp. SMC90]